MGKYRTLGTFFDRIYRNDLNANFNDIDADVQAQKKRVDDLIVANPQPSEVQDARGGFTVLRDRLDDADAQLAEIPNQTYITEKAKTTDVNNALALKADVTYANDQLALKRDKATKITGNDIDTSSDANKIKLVHLATEVQNALTGNAPANSTYAAGSITTEAHANNAVTSLKRTTLGEEGYMYTASPVNVDFVGGKIDIPSGVKFIVWRNKSYTLSSSAISILKTGSTLAGHLVFNWATNTIELLTTASITENHVSLGYIHTTVRVLNFAYTVNGKADIVGTIDNVTSKWSGKKGVTFGDSITWYDGNTFVNTHREYGTVAKGYQSYMREKLGATVDNQGYSGADITQILSSRILPYTFTNTDFVTITSGANDHRKGIPLGVVGATGGTYNTATFAGALQKAIEHILTVKPTIQIYLITPIKGWYHESGTSDVPGPYNNEMMISVDYVNVIKELGEIYSLPVCDWYHLSGINDVTKDTLIGDNDAVFTAYDLHPTNEGFRRMANVLIPFLNNY